MRSIQIFLLCIGVFYAVFATAKPLTSPRVIGGISVAEGAYPWVVNIEEDGEFICGGSLIADHWVLTAAHCVANASAKRYTLRIGINDLSKSNEGETRKVDKIIVHPDFSLVTLQNDIALIKFSTSVSVQPITLINTLAFNNFQTGQLFSVAGWGSTDAAGNIYPSILQRAEVPLIDSAQCAAYYAEGDITITDKMMCVGGEVVDSCFGDSGGPLFQETNEGDFRQVGIVSFGASKNCADGYPGIYTRVDAYADFIASAQQKDETSTSAVLSSGGAVDSVSFMSLLAFYLFFQAWRMRFVQSKII